MIDNSRTPAVTIVRADYTDPAHARDLVDLLEAYALEPMGGGKALPPSTTQHLCATLAITHGAFSLLAYVDQNPAGLTNCFMGFSTFNCAPLINIHDVSVAPNFRGLSIAKKMLGEVERIGQERGCCKLTLEVLQGNAIAKKVYHDLGFSGYELDPATGIAEFWEKSIEL